MHWQIHPFILRRHWEAEWPLWTEKKKNKTKLPENNYDVTRRFLGKKN
jgi:hypothetical protein